MTEEWFFKRLVDLSGRLRSLHKQIRRMPLQHAEEEVNTCQALLWHFYEYARLRGIDLRFYYHQLSDIQTLLNDLDFELKLLKRPWWLKILGALAKMINIIGTMLGLGPLVSALPGIPPMRSLPPPR